MNMVSKNTSRTGITFKYQIKNDAGSCRCASQTVNERPFFGGFGTLAAGTGCTVLTVAGARGMAGAGCCCCCNCCVAISWLGRSCCKPAGRCTTICRMPACAKPPGWMTGRCTRIVPGYKRNHTIMLSSSSIKQLRHITYSQFSILT